MIGLWPSETFVWILRAHRFEAPWATRVDALQVPKCRLLCRFLDAGEWYRSHALDRPASKKRQGTKSRSVMRWRCGARYGDLTAA